MNASLTSMSADLNHLPGADHDAAATSAGLPSSFARVSLAELMHAPAANLWGNVHGGEIMKLADSTAGAVAHRHSGGPAVTASMDQMVFRRPVHVGDIVRTLAQVNWVGRSSMEIGVRVLAAPWGNASDEPVHVASAFFVFVAIDDEGNPRSVPPLQLCGPEDERRFREAVIRREHRLSSKAAIMAGRKPDLPAPTG